MTNVKLPVWADPDDPSNSNSVRPRTICWGCGRRGCVDKHWGNWCFECNVKRMTRLDAAFDQISASLTA